jgi:hypothetical protein
MECMTANSSPLIEASLDPGAAVSNARVYYRSARAASVSYVEMERRGDRLEACLPPLPADAQTLTYYVVATGGSGELRTGEIRAVVVADPGLCGARRMASDCGQRLAAAVPSQSAEVVAGGGGGGFPKGVIIASGALVAGLGVFLIVRDKEPKSPSR